MESAIKHDENLQKIVPIVSYSAISRNDSKRNPEIFVDIFNLAHSSPEKIKFTEAEVHDVNVLSEMVTDEGVTYLYDKAFLR